jgi:ferredoxin
MTDTSVTMTSNPNEGEDQFYQIGKYKVQVIRKLCIGAATCVAVSPNVFQLDGQNIAVVQPNGQDSPENILAAASGCPTKAIVIIDTETGKQVWPTT